jgi:putative transposase
MSTAYKFYDPDGLYFVSFATVEWIDVFTRPDYCNIVLESFEYCQENKGLNIHAWCIMSNHLHLIISRKGNNELAGIIRDLKKFTAVKILKEIELSGIESRKNWMLWIFKSAGTKIRIIQFTNSGGRIIILNYWNQIILLHKNLTICTTTR